MRSGEVSGFIDTARSWFSDIIPVARDVINSTEPIWNRDGNSTPNGDRNMPTYNGAPRDNSTSPITQDIPVANDPRNGPLNILSWFHPLGKDNPMNVVLLGGIVLVGGYLLLKK